MKKIVEAKETEQVTIKKDMPNIKSAIFYIPLVLLIVLLATGAWAYVRYFNIAYVNGRPISRLNYIKKMEEQGGKQTLERMVQQTLITDEAAKKGINVDQATIDAELTKIEAQVKAQGATLDQALQAQGMTKADLIEQIRNQKMLEKLVPPAAVTQAQIDDFVAKNKDQFPKTATKQDIETTAKSELEKQANNEAIDTWLTNVEKSAKIIYR